MCRLCGASAWPRKSSYPARDFSRGSPDTRGYFTGIPGTYSEVPAGYPRGFGITCGRYCINRPSGISQAAAIAVNRPSGISQAAAIAANRTQGVESKIMAQQDATNVKSCCISSPSAENKRAIVLAGGSSCNEQPAHLSVVAFCCIQQGVCEIRVKYNMVKMSVECIHT